MMIEELTVGQRVLVRRPKRPRQPVIQRATVLDVGFPYITVKLDRFVEPIWVKPSAMVRALTADEIRDENHAFVERMREEGRLSEI